MEIVGVKYLMLLSFITCLVAKSVNIYALTDSGCSEGCHSTKRGYTNIHLIPFSENEAQLSFDTLTYYLGQNLNRRFTLTETGFFWNWFSAQETDLQNTLTKFIQSGNIQFVNGGWSKNTNTETSNYQEVIDQYTYGLRKLNDTLGSCAIPKVLVHIENFHKSAPPATFLSHLDYDGEIRSKIEYSSSDRIEENNTRNGVLEIKWQGQNLRGIITDIFLSATSINLNNFLNHFEYILLENNPTKHILVPVPFYEWDLIEKFENIDQLIANFQDDPKYNIIYSTPLCYIKSIYQAHIEENDFDTEAADWFSAYPNLKRHKRLENNFLQICKQMAATAHIKGRNRINPLKEAMGLVERIGIHNGTRNEMEEELSRKLYEGYIQCHDVVNNALQQLTSDKNTNYTNCMLLANTTECPFTLENDDFIVTVYNPLSRPRTKMVRLPIQDTNVNYEVHSPDGTIRPYQLIPIPEALLKKPGRNDTAKYKLVFMAPNNPELGFRSFYVKKTSQPLSTGLGLDPVDSSNMIFVTPKVNFSISNTTGLLETMNVGNILLNVTQNFFFYNTSSETPNTSMDVFSLFNYNERTKPTLRIYKGKIATEVHQVFNDWLSQVIRVYHTEDGVEFESIVGPIPDDFPRELDIVSRWTTDLKTNMTFYTDENGLNIVERKSQPVVSRETLASDYYPVTAKIALKDENRNTELMILVDKATGGSSLQDGQAEIMLLRGADAYPAKMIQSLTYVIAGPIHTKPGELTVDARSIEMVNKKFLDAWNSVSPTKGLTFEEYRRTHNMEFQGMIRSLPRNAQVMTLEPWKNLTYLIRLQHLFGKGEDATLSQPVTVDLKGLFSTFEITSIQETSLAANKVKESRPKSEENGFVKTLEPAEIRTFIVRVEESSYTSGACIEDIFNHSWVIFLIAIKTFI